jgi:MFS family permease
VALFGAEITILALPLTAAVMLGATPLQMGLLTAAGEAPFLLCSLFFGVFADRVRRRPLLIAADLGRATLLCLVPLAAMLGFLRVELLYGVAFLLGTFNALFDVAHYAYVPSLIPRDELTTANGKLQVSYSAAASIGPGLAGLLIRVVSAPIAIFATAASFLTSAALLGSIHQREDRPRRVNSGLRLREEIGEGLRALLGHQLLRPIVLISALCSLFLYGVRALYVLFASKNLGLDATQLGLILAVGGAASIPGGFLTERVTRRIGFGAAVCGGWLLEGASLLAIPFAHGDTAIATLIVAQAVGGLAGTIANVNQWSLRQAVTPDHLQARVTASHRFLVYGAFPLGALLGGYLGSTLGVVPALFVCGVGATVSPLLVLASPVRSLGSLSLSSLAPAASCASEAAA